MQSPDTILLLLQYALFAGVFMAWAWIISSWRKRRPLLEFEPRAQVPWNVLDVLAVIAIQILVTTAIVIVIAKSLGLDLSKKAADRTPQEKLLALSSDFAGSIAGIAAVIAFLHYWVGATSRDLGIDLRRLAADARSGIVAFFATAPVVFLLVAVLTKFIPYQHDVLDLVEKQPTPLVFFLMGVSAVIVAPIVEEYLFRCVLQGWLERVEHKIVGVLQGWLEKVKQKIFSRSVAPAQADVVADLPMDSAMQQSANDGTAPAPAGGFIPIFISSALFAAMHLGQGPAAIPLFVFACVLGYLYRQTHRVAPSIAMHMALNGLTMLTIFIDPAAAAPK
jgi:membrane protease YdiL (CAAX protease family)